jgi:hypothetical protein
MKTETTLDGRRRGVFPPPFRSGDRVSVEVCGSEFVTFRLMKPAEVPIVRPRRSKGRLMGAKVELDPDEIAAAIRADRDSR